MVLILVGLLACGAGAEPPPSGAEEGVAASAGQRTDVDVAGLETALAAGATLLDVRTPEEYAQGHVGGAVPLPMGFGATDPALARIDKSQPVYVICASGGRSSRAADQLAGYGFQAVNVKGGTRGWVASGREVVK